MCRLSISDNSLFKKGKKKEKPNRMRCHSYDLNDNKNEVVFMVKWQIALTENFMSFLSTICNSPSKFEWRVNRHSALERYFVFLQNDTEKLKMRDKAFRWLIKDIKLIWFIFIFGPSTVNLIFKLYFFFLYF